MALVLGFSVQGNHLAEALTFGTSRSGDLATELPAPNDFEIRFSVSLKGNTAIRDTDGNLVDEDNHRIDSSGYFIDADGVRTPVGGEDETTDAKRYHYNQEGVSIQVTNADITHVGRYDITDTSMHTLMETGEDGDQLTSSTTLRLQADAVNTVTIKISDTTPTTDLPAGASQATTITFTVYVVPGTSTNTLTLTGNGSDGITTGSDFGDIQIDGWFQVADNSPITYDVEGSGGVFVKLSEDRKTSETRTLETSSSAPVYLRMNRSSNKVTVWVRGTDAKRKSKSVILINQYADPQITGGDNQRGGTRGRLAEPLEITVKDTNNRAIPGGVVVGFASNATDSMFIPVPGTTVYIKGDDTLLTAAAPTTPDALTIVATSSSPGAATKIYVKTDSSGRAQTYFQLGTAEGSQRVTIELPGIGPSSDYSDTFFRATAANVAATSAEAITIDSGDGQRADTDEALEDPLVVSVRDAGGRLVEGATVTFTTDSGHLSAPEYGDPGTYTSNATHDDEFIEVNTDRNGKASVRYNVGDLPGGKQVFARIDVSNGRHKEKTFNLNGSSPGTTNRTGEDPDTFEPLTLSVSPTRITGEPGSQQELRITASETAQVGNIIFGEFRNAGGSASPSSDSGTFTTTLTLPDTEGTYDLVVSMGTQRETVAVEVSRAAGATATGRRLVLDVPLSGAANSQHTVRVTANDADGNRVPGLDITLEITDGGGTFSTSRVSTGTAGTATSQLTLGSTAGDDYYVTATATNYPIVEKRIAITRTQPPTDGGTSPPRDAGEPDSIDVYDGDGQRGVPNTRLSELLVVEVVDANDTPVSGVRVRFRTTLGTGRFSPVLSRTNQSGIAQTRFTPTSTGRIRIVASVDDISSRAVFNITTGEAPSTLIQVSGDTQSGAPESTLAKPFVVEVRDAEGDGIEGVPVLFSVTAGGGRLSKTSDVSDENGRAETTLTLGTREREVNSVEASVSGVAPVTFNTSIEPKILVAAANRPPMLWVDGGAIYRLVGADVQRFAPTVENAQNIAVGSGKVYWTEMSEGGGGTINSANLDGSEVTEVVSIFAVPIGIAVDTEASQLYWTNSRGRIQSANLDGSGIQNVMQNLSEPKDLSLSGGNVYWTHANGGVGFVNLEGPKQVRNIANGADAAGSLAIAGGKVYWTEMNAGGGGTINSANLDGSGATQLASILAAPSGIAVDTARSKLYWTNSRGRIQSSPLDGSGVQNVVDGLGDPGELLLSNSIAAPATATTASGSGTTAANTYDINGDGVVDGRDKVLVLEAVLAGTYVAKYDVNGDKALNILDYVLVDVEVDAGAAGAPALLGMKMSAVEIDILQEQIDLLIASGDRSPAAMRTLVYLQQLIVMARPEKTQLLANYPNPFNPETWIPYELAADTEVRITIYNAQGIVIRTLQLGQQSAGYYTDRERAAYWDGRNALGEQVASGIYFYQFETDEISALRKMVILK